MVQATIQTVEEQEKHSFTRRGFYFVDGREAWTHDVTLVRSIEVDPAVMVPQPTGEEPFPGVIRVHFMPETTDRARKQIRAAIVEAVPGQLNGYDSDPWFTLNPESGIVTQDAVQETLRVLYENNAIVLSDVIAASQGLGLKPSAYWSKGDRVRDLDGLHDASKPEEDRHVSELVASLFAPRHGSFIR